jgi:phage gp36-like protein
MTYATQADMVASFGEREVVALTDRKLIGVIDAAVLADAIALAADEIDAYLNSRYALPLVNPPRLLTRLACDIARYRLCGSDAQETEPVRNRYKDALKTLGMIKCGELTLGLDPAQQEVPERATVRMINGNRVFTQNELGDY